MKNILKITFFAFLLISFGSCTESIDPLVSPNGLTFHAPTNSGPYVLSSDNGDNDVTTLNWEAANSGLSTASASTKYTLEIAKSGTNFASPITASTSSSLLTFLWKESYLNTILVDNGFLPYVSVDIDIRVKSIMGSGSNKFIQYSNVITENVTPFAIPTLAFTKDSQDPATAPILLASGFFNSDYEGYMWLEPGDYKFFTSVLGTFSASNPFYGDNGSGSLVSNGVGKKITKPGHYLVRANIKTTGTGAMTYSANYIEAIGVFGLAVKSNPGSANMVPMVDVNNNNIWKITIDLFKGRKFRFKSKYFISLLPTTPPSVLDNPTVNPTFSVLGNKSEDNSIVDIPLPATTGGEITVPGDSDGTKQKYDITIDVSKPGNYTYTLTLNPN
ncbi:SusE domain-containing protein [Flavobacterium psychrotolerans]|uniref:SusE outer membrane protein domain-containing protein n=1 Tax=Flavobacterium psychrotolerans TaxID=2169410 RepID=A0A2U1JPJ4_9FLAO|nr:SusE domain-containing protein [Flavobacterium psychrotolerans]PWA06813.1 hypothetical protein DB895_02170 [Flavobacterium psychrotolerans]